MESAPSISLSRCKLRRVAHAHDVRPDGHDRAANRLAAPDSAAHSHRQQRVMPRINATVESGSMINQNCEIQTICASCSRQRFRFLRCTPHLPHCATESISRKANQRYKATSTTASPTSACRHHTGPSARLSSPHGPSPARHNVPRVANSASQR